jgi:accessory gene regulator B
MSIHELSVRFAGYLAQELNSDQRQELRMAYGLEILLGEIVKLVTIISLSLLLGIFPEVLTITVCAGILRLASGGEHCSEYYRCLMGGTAWFLFLGWVVRSLNNLLNQPTINISVGLLFFISIIIILKYAPGETENKPIKSENEQKKFKKWSLSIMSIYTITIILLTNIPALNSFVLPIGTGIGAI